MSSDGSFPHKRPELDAPPSEGEGGTVLDFPTDEVSSPGREGSVDEGGPDSVVPAGLWADDAEVPVAAADESTERLLRPARESAEGLGQVVAFPQPAGTHKRRRARGDEPSSRSQTRLREASGSQPTQEPAPPELDRQEATRPKFLASELLKQDWFPQAPLQRTLRWGSLGVGLAGAAVSVALGGFAAEPLGIAALFALVAVTGLAPVGAQQRGAALAMVGAAGAAWVSYTLTAEGGAVATPLLVVCAILSASALFFRAAHRTSTLARVLAGLGIGATFLWIVLSGGVDSLVVESTAWQSWVEPTSRLLLGLVAVLAVLTFLDPTGHGGGWVAGAAFLGWLVLSSGGALAVAAWPTRGVAQGFDWSSGQPIAVAALPLFAAVAACGLCQVWVMLSGRGRPLRRPSESAPAA